MIDAETIAEIRGRAQAVTVQARERLEQVTQTEREINRLAATIDRARGMLENPRNNWDSEPRPYDGGYYVLLTTINRGDDLAAWCQIREHNSSAMDHYRFEEAVESTVEDAWKHALQRAIAALEMRADQLLRPIETADIAPAVRLSF